MHFVSVVRLVYIVKARSICISDSQAGIPEAVVPKSNKASKKNLKIISVICL